MPKFGLFAKILVCVPEISLLDKPPFGLSITNFIKVGGEWYVLSYNIIDQEAGLGS